MISFQLCSNLFNINSKIQYKKHSKKIILALVFYYKLLIYQKSKATSNCMLPESSVKQKPGIILNTFSFHCFLIRRLTFLFHLLGLSKKAQECCLCIFFFLMEREVSCCQTTKQYLSTLSIFQSHELLKQPSNDLKIMEIFPDFRQNSG